MTGWRIIDGPTAWARRHPVKFFLFCLGLYWFTCMWGV